MLAGFFMPADIFTISIGPALIAPNRAESRRRCAPTCDTTYDITEIPWAIRRYSS